MPDKERYFEQWMKTEILKAGQNRKLCLSGIRDCH